METNAALNNTQRTAELATEVAYPAEAQVSQMLYEARSALVFSAQGDQEFMLEKYLIHDNVLHSPAAVTETDMQELSGIIKRAADQTRFEGIVPENVIYVKNSTIAIWVPEGPRRMFIHKNGKVYERLAWIPNTVFVYSGPSHSLDMYWSLLPIKDVLADKSCLFPAPMPNVSSAGVCIGTTMNGVTFRNNIREMAEVVVQRFYGGSFNEWGDTEIDVMALCEKAANEEPLRIKLLKNKVIRKWITSRGKKNLSTVAGP